MAPSRRGLACASWLAAALLSVAGCFADLEGLSGGESNDEIVLSAPDGGRPPTGKEGGGTPLPSERGGPLGEAGITPDGDVVPTACNGALSICDDFERASALATSWDALDELGSASATIAGAPGSRSMHVSAPAATGGNAPVALLRKRFTSDATSAVYAFDMRIDALPPTGFAELSGIDWYQGTARQRMFLRVESSGLRFYQNTVGGASTTSNLVSLSGGAWHRIELSVQIGGALILKIDGSVALSTTTGAFVKAGTPEVSAGLRYRSVPGNALVVDIDNVAFTAE